MKAPSTFPFPRAWKYPRPQPTTSVV